LILGAALFLNIAAAPAQVKKQDKSLAVKKDLQKLFKLCESERYSEAARQVVYRGSNEKRKWKDTYNYYVLNERMEVRGVCVSIQNLLRESDSYEFNRFFEETETEGTWHVWEIEFKRGAKTGKVSFAMLRVKGRYAVGDIDGHLAIADF
jgi:hypothetical protein